MADEGSTKPNWDASSDPLGARLQGALGAEYAVEGKLGSGGFAVVYLVRDVNLKRKLAVKVLSPDVIASHAVLERFKREAETVAQLSHPHIVPLHFIGNKDDLVYLVMQAIDGGSLFDRIEKEKRLPIEDASRIFGEVASALAHAHKRGVVHRDIKPQNVLLDAESGRSLVTDFGIARTAEGGSLTATGMVVGTPMYLSPEQVTGEPSDHRADIYALGVMTYEMLAGEAPFTGATPTAVLMKRLAGPPEPLKSLRPEVPSLLADLVDACLATDPNERLSNAADITRALTGASPVSGGHTTSSRIRVTNTHRAKGKVPAWVWGVAGVAIVGAVVGVLKWPRTAVAPAVPSSDAGMVLVPAGTFTIGNDVGFEVSRPQLQVQLDTFAIDQHEVTVQEYQVFIDSGKAPTPWPSKPSPMLPVTKVLWAEAGSYCAWKHPGTGRLPTEFEWEAAARGTAGRTYPWGNTWDPAAANAGNTQTRMVSVGSYPRGRTPEGVDDMIGNVWEWTSSPFTPNLGAKASTTAGYVIRGGAYNTESRYATAPYRAEAKSDAQREYLGQTGFRCAMTPRKRASR